MKTRIVVDDIRVLLRVRVRCRARGHKATPTWCFFLSLCIGREGEQTNISLRDAITLKKDVSHPNSRR